MDLRSIQGNHIPLEGLGRSRHCSVPSVLVISQRAAALVISQRAAAS